MRDAVTATAGVLCLVGAALLAFPGRMQWPRLIAALTLTASAGILNSTIGPVIHRAVTTLDSQVGHLIGRWTGTTIVGLVGFIVVGVAAFWIYQRRIDLRTLGLVAAVPPTVTLIPGTVGSVATVVAGLVPTVISNVIMFLFTGQW